MRAAREARDAGYESVGVTGYRNLAIMAARVMDHRSAEIAIGEGLQYADAIEQSHCRQMMATTTALLDWARRPLGCRRRARPPRARRSRLPARHHRLARRHRSRRAGPRPRRRGAALARGVARRRPPHRRGAAHPDPAVGAGRGATCSRATPSGDRDAVRGGVRDRDEHRRARAAHPVRRDRGTGLRRGATPRRCRAVGRPASRPPRGLGHRRRDRR